MCELRDNCKYNEIATRYTDEMEMQIIGWTLEIYFS